MFYEIIASENIRIPPSMLNMDTGDAALAILKDRYERRYVKDIGFILLIKDVQVKEEGTIIPSDPYIYYEVEFKAIIFDLSVNEVVKGVVKDIVDFGAFISLGPVEALLHISQIGSTKYVLDKKIKSLIPNQSKKDKKTVKKGDVVLAKISTISWKAHITDTKVGVTMRASGLYDESWLKKRKE